jgi:single-strand DNA-binding protein
MDPKIRNTDGGNTIAGLSLATTYQRKDKEPVTEWHQLVAFGRTAEIIRDYVHRGSKLYIEGRLQTRKWDKDGETRYSTEVVIGDLSLLSSKAGDASKSSALRGGTHEGVNPEITDDDIPF